MGAGTPYKAYIYSLDVRNLKGLPHKVKSTDDKQRTRFSCISMETIAEGASTAQVIIEKELRALEITRINDLWTPEGYLEIGCGDDYFLVYSDKKGLHFTNETLPNPENRRWRFRYGTLINVGANVTIKVDKHGKATAWKPPDQHYYRTKNSLHQDTSGLFCIVPGFDKYEEIEQIAKAFRYKQPRVEVWLHSPIGGPAPFYNPDLDTMEYLGVFACGTVGARTQGLNMWLYPTSGEMNEIVGDQHALDIFMPTHGYTNGFFEVLQSGSPIKEDLRTRRVVIRPSLWYTHYSKLNSDEKYDRSYEASKKPLITEESWVASPISLVDHKCKRQPSINCDCDECGCSKKNSSSCICKELEIGNSGLLKDAERINLRLRMANLSFYDKSLEAIHDAFFNGPHGLRAIYTWGPEMGALYEHRLVKYIAKDLSVSNNIENFPYFKDRKNWFDNIGSKIWVSTDRRPSEKVIYNRNWELAYVYEQHSVRYMNKQLVEHPEELLKSLGLDHLRQALLNPDADGNPHPKGSLLKGIGIHHRTFPVQEFNADYTIMSVWKKNGQILPAPPKKRQRIHEIEMIGFV